MVSQTIEINKIYSTKSALRNITFRDDKKVDKVFCKFLHDNMYIGKTMRVCNKNKIMV
jgi:hypothetical protein